MMKHQGSIVLRGMWELLAPGIWELLATSMAVSGSHHLQILVGLTTKSCLGVRTMSGIISFQFLVIIKS